MMIKAIDELLGTGLDIVNRIFPDPAHAKEHSMELARLAAQGDLETLKGKVELLRGQQKINEQAAQHKSIFVAGARPFIIWACGFSLVFNGLVHPMLMWVASALAPEMAVPPVLDSATMNTILGSLLGIGTMRSYDKMKGTDTNRVVR